MIYRCRTGTIVYILYLYLKWSQVVSKWFFIRPIVHLHYVLNIVHTSCCRYAAVYMFHAYSSVFFYIDGYQMYFELILLARLVCVALKAFCCVRYLEAVASVNCSMLCKA